MKRQKQIQSTQETKSYKNIASGYWGMVASEKKLSKKGVWKTFSD